MQVKTEQIKLSDTEKSSLPLGYKKIKLNKIPMLEIENKLMVYNRKYNFSTTNILGSYKPISKILE